MEKLSMSKLKDILRLKYESNLCARQIARALNVSVENLSIRDNKIGRFDKYERIFEI